MDLKSIQFSKDIEEHFLKYFSKSHYEKICRALTTPPLITYFRERKFNEEQNDSNSFLQFQTTIQNFVNKQCEEKQWEKIQLMKCPIDILSNEVLCFPVNVMDIETFNNLPRYDKVVIVDIYCGKSVLRGSDIYSPGLLSISPNVKINDIVSIYVDIEGKILRASRGPYESKLLFIGNGQILVNRIDIFSKTPNELQGIGVKMIDSIYKSPSFGSDDSINDRVFLQNLPSILCAKFLEPKPQQLILDMCSAPGGKTMHLANLTKDKAKIIALDKSKPKIQILNEELKKYKFSSIKAYNVDATKLVSQVTKNDALLLNPDLLKVLNIENESFSYDTIEQFLPSEEQKISLNQKSKNILRNKNTDENEKNILNKFKALSNIRCSVFPDESFDVILLDPPCSALGQRPMFSCDMTLEGLLTFHSYQRALFKVAHRLLKPGGRIVFSTCTFNPKENEEQVAWILETFNDMILENLREKLPFAKSHISVKDIHFDHIEDLENNGEFISVSPSKIEKIKQCTLRFDPGDDICFKDDTIGFFIASFIKKKIIKINQ
jgi:16S rRNA C967 or C1407 C5-methylase (RsmB/RsmF family)/predicted ribosome-associated RNA-binding protein Tma20